MYEGELIIREKEAYDYDLPYDAGVYFMTRET